MITKSKAYISSPVPATKTRQDVEAMLEKHAIRQIAWMRDSPDKSYVLFRRTINEQLLAYKVTIPFIEKEIQDPANRYRKKTVYDEIRSYRFFFHIFKSAFLNTEIGMTFEEMFSNYMVIGQQEDGTPMTVQEKIQIAILDKKIPQLGIDNE